MSDDRNKLAQMRQRITDHRRENAAPLPRPDPNSPHDPYHLPYANMDPSRMPTAADAARAGAGFLQAEMTLMLPNAIFNNLPPRLMNDFYQLTWDLSKGHGDLFGFVAKMEDHELAVLLKEVDSFPLDQLTAGGAKFYEALIEEMDRRHPKLPQRRVRVEATIIDTSRQSQHEPLALEAHEEERARPQLPQRTFPGPPIKPRT